MRESVGAGGMQESSGSKCSNTLEVRHAVCRASWWKDHVNRFRVYRRAQRDFTSRAAVACQEPSLPGNGLYQFMYTSSFRPRLGHPGIVNLPQIHELPSQTLCDFFRQLLTQECLQGRFDRIHRVA